MDRFQHPLPEDHYLASSRLAGQPGCFTLRTQCRPSGAPVCDRLGMFYRDKPVAHRRSGPRSVKYPGQAEVFLGLDVAEHRAAGGPCGSHPADHRPPTPSRGGDVVVVATPQAPPQRHRAQRFWNGILTGSISGAERPERVEGRFTAPFELLGHVFLDHVHGHVARWPVRLAPFVHDLHAFGPSAAGEFALHFEFAELHGGRPQGLVGVGHRAGAQAVALMAITQFNWGKTFQIQFALKVSVNQGKLPPSLALIS